MDLFVLYKCSLLITAVTRVQFSNSTSTNETDMTPHTLNVLSGNHDAGIGPASPLSHNAGSDINLTSMVEQQRCRLEETCHHKKLSSCDFTGCQLETKLYLQGLGESKWLLGTLPENLNAFLPNLKVLDLSDNRLYGSVETLGKLTGLRELYIGGNNFTGNVDALGNLHRLKRLYIHNNKFTGNVDFLGKLKKLQQLSLAHNKFSGSFDSLERIIADGNLKSLFLANMGTDMLTSVPNNVFELAPDDIMGLNLACRIPLSDQSPLAKGTDDTHIFQINELITLKCGNKLPLLSDGQPVGHVTRKVCLQAGNWDVIKIDKGTCEEKELALVSTEVECKEAALKLGESFGPSPPSAGNWPYCFYHTGEQIISLGSNDDRPARIEKENFGGEGYGLCKKVTARAKFQCIYNENTKKAEWTPDISNHRCLGVKTCKLSDTNAEWLKRNFGADVSGCSTRQEGNTCTDYSCTQYESHVRATNGKIRCMYGVWERRKLDYCTFCPPGQHKVNETSCEACAAGKYLISSKDKDLTECQNCMVGHYWANDANTQGCIKCEVGEYQDVEAQTSCKPCRAGQYNDATGSSNCRYCVKGKFQSDEGDKKCDQCPEIWWYSCPEGSAYPVLDIPLVAMVVVFSVIGPLAVILISVKVKEVITTLNSIYKPQSEEDALLAKEFVLPKTSTEMKPYVEAFKGRLENFVDNKGWSPEERSIILEHCNIVVQYLGRRVEEATDDDARRIMYCCLEMNVLHDFKTLYDATMKNIRNKEKEGFIAYNNTVPKLQGACSVCPPNASDLMELYETGRVAYPLFHAFIADAASASGTAYLFKSHGKQPGMKGLYRVLEKAVFKYNGDIEEALDYGKVRDLVRGGIIDTEMKGLAKVAEYILNSTEVTLCRVKDRFNEPSPGGWADLMINFYLNNDPGKHVCEVQLIHFKMLSQRTTQEGHGAYNIYRAAAELLNHKTIVKSPVRILNKAFAKVEPEVFVSRFFR